MRGLPAILLALVWMVACHRQPRLATLPPARAAAAPVKDATLSLPEPPSPQEAASTPSSAPLAIGSYPQQPIPPPATPPKRTRRMRSVIPLIAPAIQPPAPAAPDPVSLPDPPMLGQMLNAQEQARYNHGIDSDLKSARRNLGAASARNLDDSQKATVRQIQTFIVQAEELRKSDLVAAKGLSRKADLLARDLLARAAK